MKNKVILINPDLPQKPTQFNIPISLLYLGTWLSHKGYDINILDAYNHKSDIYQRLEDQSWDSVLAVGFSVMTASISSALALTRHIKYLSPTTPIIWGGVHPTLYPKQVAQNPYIDFSVFGEGELTTEELLLAIEKNNNIKSSRFAQINGVAYQNKSGITIMTPDREQMDINELEYPKLDLMEDVRDVDDIGILTKQVQKGLPLVTSRGCPHRCVFCINSVTKQKYRFRSAELVVQDLKKMCDQGVTEICFVDEDFLANKPRLIKILDGIEEHGLKFKWFGTARADYFGDKRIDQTLLKRLKANGCTQIGMGLESGSQRVLDMIKKDITIEDSINSAKMLSEAGISITLSFMTGLPDETTAEINETASLIAYLTSIDSTFRILPNLYRPYAGSILYNKCLSLGMKEPEDLEGWVDNPYMKGDTVMPSEYCLFPWVQYPMGKLLKLNFYSWMAGLRTKGLGLTTLTRKIGSWRLRHLCFVFPIEVLMLSIFQRLDLVRKMGRGKFN